LTVHSVVVSVDDLVSGWCVNHSVTVLHLLFIRTP
jgi:hypothetical protein